MTDVGTDTWPSLDAIEIVVVSVVAVSEVQVIRTESFALILGFEGVGIQPGPLAWISVPVDASCLDNEGTTAGVAATTSDITIVPTNKDKCFVTTTVLY